MDADLGLRERKKKQTRHVIAETALRLFNERGFDAVTVAQVAKAADVSEATVFNYFPTKESLFFGQMQSFEEALIQAVRERSGGEHHQPEVAPRCRCRRRGDGHGVRRHPSERQARRREGAPSRDLAPP